MYVHVIMLKDINRLINIKFVTYAYLYFSFQLQNLGGF